MEKYELKTYNRTRKLSMNLGKYDDDSDDFLPMSSGSDEQEGVCSDENTEQCKLKNSYILHSREKLHRSQWKISIQGYMEAS